MLTRRQLLKTGVAGVALLGAARLVYGPITPDPRFDSGAGALRVLDPKSATALAAIARVMLHGALPRDDAARHEALQQAVRGCDIAISGLPGTVQDEVKQLLTLLNSRLSRRWLVGVTSPWEEASDEQIAHFLSRWRYSSLLLMRSGYQALHQIIFAAWYGSPTAWPAIGYDGPPEFMKAYWHA